MLADDLKHRMTKPIQVRSILDRVGNRLYKELKQFQQLFVQQEMLDEVVKATTHQLAFHLKAALENAETLEAAEGHKAEAMAQLEALLAQQANTITPVMNFDLTFLQSDPKFMQDHLVAVDKTTFASAFSQLSAARRKELLAALEAGPSEGD